MSNDNILNIATTEARLAAETEKTLKGRLMAAMAVVKNHWILTDEGERIRAAVAAVMSLSNDDDRKRLLAEWDFLIGLSSKNSNISVILENPIGIMSKQYRKPDQIVQPYFFGNECQKATCLWLKNLPLLTPTNIVDRGLIYIDPRGNKHGGAHTLRAKRAYSPLMLLAKNEERWKIRSRTFQGIADAMAEQWG